MSLTHQWPARREKTVTAGAADFLRASRTGVLTLGPEVEAEAIANCFAAKRGDLQGVSTGGKNVPFGFSGVKDCREIYPVAPAATVFSLLAIGESMTSCIKIESDVRVRDINSNRATVGIISNFNPLRGSFPLLLSSACLRHYALLMLANNGLISKIIFIAMLALSSSSPFPQHKCSLLNRK